MYTVDDLVKKIKRGKQKKQKEFFCESSFSLKVEIFFNI